MQDENIIEAHHGQKALVSPTIVKNKPEEAEVEGAPPRKTQKLFHLSPSQALARTPFNPVSNTPSKKYQSPTLTPGKSKNGKQGQGQNDKTLNDTDTSPVQTRLNFPTVSKEHDATDDLNTLESLENTLAEYKQMIKDLQDELAQETAYLEEQRQIRNEQEEALMMELDVAEDELSHFRRQEADQVDEMSKLDALLVQLGLENENMDMDLKELEGQVQEYEDKTAQELSRSELEILTEEIQRIGDEYDLAMRDMEEQIVLREELELRVDPVAGEGLLHDIRTLEKDIRQLEQMIQDEGNDPEIPLDLSIEEEFAVLTARFKLPRRSDTEKKLLEAQGKIKEEYYRQLNALKFKHSARMEQILGKTTSHETRLTSLRSKITLADETIARSSKELEEIDRERQTILAQRESLLFK
ncbi:hypothetical protein CPB97_007202 [Podila verticillata]|nr:hypothetical protein CPB97_007202 [Podila verticillata]